MNNMNKIIMAVVITALVAGAGSFYGGMVYGTIQAKGKGPVGLANLSADERQQRFAQVGTGARGQNSGGGMISGDILSLDQQSITVKQRDGSTKIVFFSTSTEVSRFTAGTVSDLVVGNSVTVSGKTNQDGSVTAQSIQLRPAGAGPGPAKQSGQPNQ